MTFNFVNWLLRHLFSFMNFSLKVCSGELLFLLFWEGWSQNILPLSKTTYGGDENIKHLFEMFSTSHK